MSSPEYAPSLDDFYRRMARMLPDSYLFEEADRRRTPSHPRIGRTVHGIDMDVLAATLDSLGTGTFSSGELRERYTEKAAEAGVAAPSPRGVSWALGSLGVESVKIQGYRKFKVTGEVVEAMRLAG